MQTMQGKFWRYCKVIVSIFSETEMFAFLDSIWTALHMTEHGLENKWRWELTA